MNQYRDEKQALRLRLDEAEAELAAYQTRAAQRFDCPTCGHKIDPGTQFCPGCGAALRAPTAATTERIQPRSTVMVAVLSIVTLSLYNIYLTYRWVQEVNAALGEERRSPRQVLVVCILTLGLGALVYECLIARELREAAAYARRPMLHPTLDKTVLILNVAALISSFLGVTAPLGMILGTVATVGIQKELNHLSEGASSPPPSMPLVHTHDDPSYGVDGRHRLHHGPLDHGRSGPASG